MLRDRFSTVGRKHLDRSTPPGGYRRYADSSSPLRVSVVACGNSVGEVSDNTATARQESQEIPPMTSTIGPRAGDDTPPALPSPIAISRSIPTRRSSFSTPLEAVRRRQEALERLAARRIVTPPPTVRRPADLAHLHTVASASVGSGMQSAPGGGEPVHPRVPLTSREVEVLRTWLLTDSKSVAASRFVV